MKQFPQTQQDLFSQLKEGTLTYKVVDIATEGELSNYTTNAKLVLHEHENNLESQKHLDANRKKFTGQLATVYNALMEGKIIASDWGIYQHPKIMDTGRRLRNLLASGVAITEDWVTYENDKRSHKRYFMTPEQINSNREKYGSELT